MDCDALRDAIGNGSKDLCLEGPRVSAVLAPITGGFWMRCCGWRARAAAGATLPERFGNFHSMKRRYYRWIKMGVLDAVLAALAREADLEWLMIDSTIVRAHQHAAGARKAKGGRMPRAWVGLEAV